VSFWEDERDGDLEGRSGARGAPGAARAQRRGARPLRRAARRDPRSGRQGLRARPRGCRADAAPARALERLGRGPADAVAARRGRAGERARRRGQRLPRARRMIDTLRLTAEEAHGLIERGEVTGAELHRAYLDATAERDSELHAYLCTVDEPEGDGVPIALKDVISTRGLETTAASKILAGYKP